MNKIRPLSIALAMLFLMGCGTKQYIPEEAKIAIDEIQFFKIAGTVSVENKQPDITKVIVCVSNSGDYLSDYHLVTEHMIEQLKKELIIHGSIISKPSEKTIGLKVVKEKAYLHIFHMTGDLEVWVTLGKGEAFLIRTEHGSPGGVRAVLDGNIANGVIEILSDKRVLSYLAE